MGSHPPILLGSQKIHALPLICHFSVFANGFILHYFVALLW